MEQLKAARRFVERKTENAGENDLIIFAGDFNACGPTNVKEAKSYKEHLKQWVSNILQELT
jgi:hypothetical protein